MPMTKRVCFSDFTEDDDGESTACQQREGGDGVEEEQDYGEEEEEHDAYVGPSLSAPRRRPPSFPPRVAYCSDGAPTSFPISPVRKKITALQDRRVNTILLEALQLVECSKDELGVIEKSVKKLRDAIYGFSILVDRQVNIIGVETLEERGRIRADIQDLAENLKISYEVFEATCGRMRQTLSLGKQQIQLHKKRHDDRAGASSQARKLGSKLPASSPTRKTPQVAVAGTPSPTVAEAGIYFTPAADRVPLLSMIERQPSELDTEGDDTSQYMTPEFFQSLTRSVGLDEKEFLDTKDLVRFAQEMLTFSIARSQTLTFMGKAFHRRLIPTYAKDIVRLLLDDLQLVASAGQPILLPSNTFSDFLCEPPSRFDAILDRLYVADANHYTGEPSPTATSMAAPPVNPFSDHVTANGGVLHGGKVVKTLLVNKPDPELLETAEQTLAMAKLLHDLATAESEARQGNRMSVRPQAARASEFSKAYLAASKELLSKEAGVN